MDNRSIYDILARLDFLLNHLESAAPAKFEPMDTTVLDEARDIVSAAWDEWEDNDAT